MTKQIFPFIFYFISFITLYSPLTFSLIPRANSNLYSPIELIHELINILYVLRGRGQGGETRS